MPELNKPFSKRIDGRMSYFIIDYVDSYFGPIHTHLTSLEDITHNELFSYNENCASCYLHHAHSRLYHEKQLAEHAQRQKQA